VTSEPNQTNRNSGSIYTPADFAELLSLWAVVDKNQHILDVGVGEGSITFAAYERLLALGATRKKAQQQIHGTEINPLAFTKFQKASEKLNAEFPNIYLKDFFLAKLPEVDVVIGNPPYVRRSKIHNFNVVKDSFLAQTEIKEDLSALTDLYIYFILQACTKLKSGGRLAVITSDSWLNARYGTVFKNYLKDNFEVESLVSLDRNIFQADVKALITLAIKKTPSGNKITHFTTVKNGLPAKEILQLLTNSVSHLADVEVKPINLTSLASSDSWGIQFKAPDFYEEILQHEKITRVREVANTRIGIQTLAKDFFVLSPDKISNLELEAEFFVPLIQSNRNYSHPIIKEASLPNHYLFYCNVNKNKLSETKALGYIESAESIEVSIRGKNESVIGYQNKERIKSSRRSPWYNLKTELQKRNKTEILIPRIVSKCFRVYWNQAQYVPGEFFIEFNPKNKEIKTEVYLAILSSSLFDMCLRVKSQLYGGGAYSVYPGQFRDIPIINPMLLEEEQRLQLETAYLEYLSDEVKGRKAIDKVILKILGWDISFGKKINRKLNDLINVVDTFQKTHPETSKE